MKRLFASKTANGKTPKLKELAVYCKNWENFMGKFSDNCKKIMILYKKAQKCKNEAKEKAIFKEIDKVEDSFPTLTTEDKKHEPLGLYGRDVDNFLDSIYKIFS